MEIQGHRGLRTPVCVSATPDDPAQIIAAMCLVLGDLVGTLERRRWTLTKYSDAANFPAGNPTADPAVEFPQDLWYVEQKSGDVSPQIEFTRTSALDLNGQRQIVANACQWLAKGGYRGPYCDCTGATMFDRSDNPTTGPAQDKCAGRALRASAASVPIRHFLTVPIRPPT